MEKEVIEFKLSKSTNEVIMCHTRHYIINYSIHINGEYIKCIQFVHNKQSTKIVKSFFIYSFVGQYSLLYRKIADIYVILYGL